jgi:ribose-phosphate pyrophosphokinase
VVSGQILTGEVQDRELVIFDDMISSGTTILRAAVAAKRAGARRVIVMATHPALLPEAMRLCQDDAIETVIVSDSIALPVAFRSLPETKLKICSLAPLFAQTIRTLTR